MLPVLHLDSRAERDTPGEPPWLAGLNAPQITAMALAALGKEALAEPARA
jgi:hypothetical protein